MATILGAALYKLPNVPEFYEVYYPHNCNIADEPFCVGTWHITKRYNLGGGPTFADIMAQIVRKIDRKIDHRRAIINRLYAMGADRPSKLKQTQYKTFYNFLTNLE